MNIRTEIIKLLANELELKPETSELLLEYPPNENMGDIALPCFRFAKELRQAPAQIAQSFCAKLQGKAEFLSRIECQGAYLNFFYQREAFAQTILTELQEQANGFSGKTEVGAGQTVLVEYSSPNIAKPFHVGHAFSTFLGQALANLYTYLGYKVVRLNHIGDYGTQFGKLIVAWRRWGNPAALDHEPIKELARVYTLFHKEMAQCPELETEGREAFRLLEAGSQAEYDLWAQFKDLSLQEFARLYSRLEVEFDRYQGESFYSDKLTAAIDLLRSQNLLVESQGAQVVLLDEYGLNPCLILKSDGSSIYATRDLAAILYRVAEWDFTKCIYVVGLEQINHFKQVFAVLEKAKFPRAQACVHVPFGRVKFPRPPQADEGADTSAYIQLSTREGNVILLEDLLNEAVSKTAAIISQNNTDMSDSEIAETAEIVGIAAVKYCYLHNGREKDIIFSWDEVLNFDQDSAPYLLYTYARAKSILRKANYSPQSTCQFERLILDEEFALIKLLEQLQSAAKAAALNYEPSLLLRHIANLARAFNKYYHNVPILKAAEADLIQARLALITIFASQLKLALELLGLKTVERM